MAECDIEGGTLRYTTAYSIFFILLCRCPLYRITLHDFIILACCVQVYNSKLSNIGSYYSIVYDST